MLLKIDSDLSCLLSTDTYFEVDSWFNTKTMVDDVFS